MQKARLHHYTAPIQNNMLGIIYIMVHVIALAILYTAVKTLTKDLNSNVIVFLYKVSILIFIIPWCFYHGFAAMKTKRIGLHVARAFLSIMGQLSMFYAIKHIGLSDVTAVQYLEHVVVLIIGILYFKEKATKTKFAAIALSFLGALFVVRSDWFDPNVVASEFKGFNTYFIFVFMALMFWAMNNTLIKILGKTEKTKVQLFYVMLFSCILAFPTAFMHWEAITYMGPVEISYPTYFVNFEDLNIQLQHIKFILLLALCYFMHAIFHFKAFKHAELSVIIPFEYTRLIFAGILGYIYFEEVPTAFKLYGYLMIIGAGLYLLRSERRRLKRTQAKRALVDEFSQQ